MRSKRVLITSGRYPMTLSLARQLHASGHEVYVSDVDRQHFCRYSRAVRGVIQTASPAHHPDTYISNIVEAINAHGIDLLIPGWEEVLVLARYRECFPDCCRLFAPDYELLHRMHHKGLFMHLTEELGLAVPAYRLMQSDFRSGLVAETSLALKACYSRSSREVYFVSKGEEIPHITPTAANPWLEQEWLDGPMHCSYSVCDAGRVLAHVVYPMEFIQRPRSEGKGNAGSYCLSYVACEHPRIDAWTREFVCKTGFTGQVAFDFAERSSDGQLFAIDCNPRMTHGVCLFHSKDRLDRAFFGWEGETLRPRPGSSRQLFMANLTMGWRLGLRAGRIGLYLQRLLCCPDIVFSGRDLGPALFQAIAACQLLRLRFKSGMPTAAAFSADIDFNGPAPLPHRQDRLGQ